MKGMVRIFHTLFLANLRFLKMLQPIDGVENVMKPADNLN